MKFRIDPSSSIPDSQASQNRSTAGQWNLYTSHRSAMERLLVPETPGTKTLCVLGAGNCNDLDLDYLTTAYRQLHLVDIDRPALEAAVERQKPAHQNRITLHAPIDLTGAADAFTASPTAKPSESDASRYLKQVNEAPLPSLGPYDTVISPCVLSQLIFPLRQRLGSDHSLYPAIRAAIRSRHLRLMQSLLHPAGRALLILDLISSETLPNLTQAPEDQLPGLMSTALSTGKHFRGLQPAAISATFRDDPLLRHSLPSLRFTPPWRWHLSLQKSFLVYAATWTRGGILT